MDTHANSSNPEPMNGASHPMRDLVSLDRTHSAISPSSYERVDNCSMSLKLSQHAPRAAPGIDALIGTAAHSILERCLKQGLDTFELGGLDAVQVDGHAIEVDVGMLDGVQLCLDTARRVLHGRRIEVEKTLHLGFAEAYLGQPIWGHADVSTPDLPIVIIDFKYGYNPVAADAVQLALYLLMQLLEFDQALEGDGPVGTTIVVQPNAPGEPVRSHDWTWADMRLLRNRVIDLLRRIKRGDFTYQDGPWCRFCPAVGFCPYLASVARDAAMTAIVPTPELVATGEVSADKLADWLDLVERLDHWSKAVQMTALDYVVHGGVLKNRKAVHKKTNRRWRNDQEATAWLQDEGVDPWNVPKLITPAQAEKKLPRLKRPEVQKHATKPAGELTLAPMDDPREAVDVTLTLKAALEASVAAGYIEAATNRAKALTNHTDHERKEAVG